MNKPLLLLIPIIFAVTIAFPYEADGMVDTHWMNITTDKKLYHFGEQVTVTAQVHDWYSDEKVQIFFKSHYYDESTKKWTNLYHMEIFEYQPNSEFITWKIPSYLFEGYKSTTELQIDYFITEFSDNPKTFTTFTMKAK